MLYLQYILDSLSGFSTSTHVVVISFSLISMLFMKERIGWGAAILYFPVMVGCALISNYLFWSNEVFRGDQDLERVFTATIVGMMFSLLLIIVINNIREYYWSLPVRHEGLYDENA